LRLATATIHLRDTSAPRQFRRRLSWLAKMAANVAKKTNHNRILSTHLLQVAEPIATCATVMQTRNVNPRARLAQRKQDHFINNLIFRPATQWISMKTRAFCSALTHYSEAADRELTVGSRAKKAGDRDGYHRLKMPCKPFAIMPIVNTCRYNIAAIDSC
jgi:hypothetical protein